MILDGLDKTGTFLTSDRPLVVPYKVYVGGEKPQIMFGKDLDGNISSLYLSRIHHVKKVEIRAWDNRLLFRALEESSETFQLESSIRFHLLELELFGSDNSPEIECWGRNGMVLGRDGRVFQKGIITMKGVVMEPA